MRQKSESPSYPERHCRVAGFHTSDNGGRMDYFIKTTWGQNPKSDGGVQYAFVSGYKQPCRCWEPTQKNQSHRIHKRQSFWRHGSKSRAAGITGAGYSVDVKPVLAGNCNLKTPLHSILEASGKNWLRIEARYKSNSRCAPIHSPLIGGSIV